MGRLDRREVGDQCLGDRRHGARRVPEVWIRRRIRQLEQLLHVDHPARGAGRGGLDAVHVAVVAQAILHNDARSADFLRDARARLEGVRVGVRVALDRGDAHVPAADLADHVRVLILGADSRDQPARGARWARTEARSSGSRAAAGTTAAASSATIAAAATSDAETRRKATFPNDASCALPHAASCAARCTERTGNENASRYHQRFVTHARSRYTGSVGPTQPFGAPLRLTSMMPLVRRPRRGETRAEFERFVEGCADGLLSTAYLIVWDRAEAEDLVQETLLRVAQRWPRVREMDQRPPTAAGSSSTSRSTVPSAARTAVTSSSQPLACRRTPTPTRAQRCVRRDRRPGGTAHRVGTASASPASGAGAALLRGPLGGADRGDPGLFAGDGQEHCLTRARPAARRTRARPRAQQQPARPRLRQRRSSAHEGGQR